MFMRKSLLLLTILSVYALSTFAQYYPPPPRPYGMPPHRGMHQQRQQRIDFKPSVNLSIGYGFPNLDYYLLDEFYGYYHGSASYTGPISGSLDYKFSPMMSIGIMASYGKVSRPYYSFDTNIKTFSGSMNNTSIMLDFMRYLPGSKNVNPYFRTAIGVNTGRSEYSDLNDQPFFANDDHTTLAYQASIGVQLYVSNTAGFFVEAGYGKYIIAGGLSFKFQ